MGMVMTYCILLIQLVPKVCLLKNNNNNFKKVFNF